MDDILKLLQELTTEEKAALVSGTDFMYTNPVPRLNIPSIRMSDGPHGLRVQKENGDNGVAGSEPATAFPTAVSNSIITMSMSAGTNCPYNFAQGFVNMANGHLFKGIKCFCTKIKVPKLPKEKEEK